MNDTEETYVGEELPTWALALFGSLHVLTSINGVFGSVLILMALTRDRHFRVSSCTYTVYMANLVVTDLYFQLYYFPMLAVGFALGRYPMVDEVHCIVTGYLAMACYSIFLLTLTAISMDRYMRVCHDSIYRRHFSWKTSLCTCAAIWLLGCMVPLPGAVNNLLGFDIKTHLCFTKSSAGASVSLPYLLVFSFSIVASGFFNLKIYLVYRATRRRVQQHFEGLRIQNPTESQLQKTVTSSDLALLRSLLVIFFCLVLFVMPGSLARGLRSKVNISSTLYAFFLWMLSLNSSIDWIVYGLLNSRFRICYKRFLSRCNLPCCTPESQGVSTTTATN